MNLAAFDLETSGSLPEYALQPWRVRRGDAWITCFVGARRLPTGQPEIASALFHDPMIPRMREFFQGCLDRRERVAGWNLAFDISWLLALGDPDLTRLVFQTRWLDGMLLWRHAAVEPEYDTDRGKRKSYGLKAAVAERWPEHAGYEDDVDFHATDPESLSKLLAYNTRDTLFTLRLTWHWWQQLEARQRRAALIEADTLPYIALANLQGMVVDTLVTRELEQHLTDVAAQQLEILAPHGVTEKVVRSPKQLEKLLFDEWRLPVIKENIGKKTGNVSRSTDKEALHELSFVDPRAKDLRTYREALNNRTKFATALLESQKYNGDGKVHPLAHPFGTYCVPGDVEVLTRSGWERLDQWQGGDIMQVHPDLNMEFLPAERFVGPVTDTWVHVQQRGLDCMFTPGHTVPYLTQKTYAWRTTQAANLLTGEQRSIPVAGNARLEGGYTPLQMRLFAAVQADGYSAARYLKFTLKKQRKIDRLVALLTEAGIRHRVYVCEAYPDRTEIVIAKSFRPDWLGHDKKTLGPWLLDTTAEGLRAFVDEVVHWDGSPHPDGGVKYTSSSRENCEWVVTAAALTGRKASLHAISRGMSSVHLSDLDIRAARTVSPRYVQSATKTQRAYCATTRTGFWLARSNGSIFVTGNTGRLTYSSKQGKNKDERPIGFALHQEKRDPKFRNAVQAPPGHVIVEFDASGQEYRWMAIASGDETMLGLCMPGEDPHSYMGANIANLDYRWLQANAKVDEHAGAMRQMGKVGNLSCQYRVSKNKLLVVARVQYDMPLTIDDAALIHTMYPRTYPGVKRYWSKQVQVAKRQGYVETFAGRRVQLLGEWNKASEWQMGSTAINYPIQGTGGDQKYLALSMLRPLMRETGARFAWDLHDGIYFYVPEEQAQTFLRRAQSILNNLPYKEAWGFEPPIPLPWDAKIGYSWGTLKEHKHEQ